MNTRRLPSIWTHMWRSYWMRGGEWCWLTTSCRMHRLVNILSGFVKLLAFMCWLNYNFAFIKIVKLIKAKRLLKLANNYKSASANTSESLVPGTPEEAPSQCCQGDSTKKDHAGGFRCFHHSLPKQTLSLLLTPHNILWHVLIHL